MRGVGSKLVIVNNDNNVFFFPRRMSSGSCNPVGNPFSAEELEDEVADLDQAKRSSENIHSTSEVGLGNPGPWEDRGPRGRGFPDRGRGGFVDRGRGFGDRGRWSGNRGRGFGRGDFGSRGWRGGHPREVPRHPEPGFSRGGRGFGRGGAGHMSGTGEGPLYGRKMNGDFEKYNEDTRIPSLQDKDMFVQHNFRHRVNIIYTELSKIVENYHSELAFTFQYRGVEYSDLKILVSIKCYS